MQLTVNGRQEYVKNKSCNGSLEYRLAFSLRTLRHELLVQERRVRFDS